MNGRVVTGNESACAVGDLKYIQHYREAGFTLLQGCFHAEEIASWRAECDRLVAELQKTDHPRVSGRKHLSLGAIMDRLDPVLDLSPIFSALASDQRLTNPTEALIGGPVALFKDKLIMKPPGTYGYDVHQDYPYWELLGIPAEEMLSVWVAIDEANEKNGALEIYPGMHQSRIPGTPDAPMDTDPSLLEGFSPKRVDLMPGDVMFFHSLAPHRSAPNHSAQSRRCLLLTYVPQRFAHLYHEYYRKKLH
ncbi:MAG TPA: phytanoyl-CoA dioxygenase family protein [Kiritimatiellia bacterium]|nr:phytanoyl-CoA dioxygenase family protein [Kiritimatiellia bacterium]